MSDTKDQSNQSLYYSLLLITIWSLLFYNFWLFDIWGRYAIPHINPMFADLHGTLSAIDCYKLGYNVFINNPCDNMNRIFPYGSLWLYLGNLGVNNSHLFIIGVITCLIFIISCTLVVRPNNFREFFFTTIYLCSPATLLALERSNTDVYIFVILLFSGFLISKNNFLLRLGGIMAAFLAMLLKIYPIVVFAVIVLASSSKKYFYWIFFTVVYVILIWVKLDYQQLQLLNSIITRPTGIYTFGFSELLGYTGNFKWLIILLAISGFLISLKKIIPKIQIRFLTTKDVKAIYYLYGLIITGSLFLITTSYDYKLIFIIFTLPLLFSKNGILVNIAITLGACVLWAEYARQLLHVPLAHYYFNDMSTTHLTATLDFLIFIKNLLIAVYLSFMFILGAIVIFPKKINASIK